jgi:hypothetical protein
VYTVYIAYCIVFVYIAENVPMSWISPDRDTQLVFWALPNQPYWLGGGGGGDGGGYATQAKIK